MTYDAQNRGSAAAYSEYFSSMDRSMRQKVALVTSFFPTRGRVADMGCGSGMGSSDLAALYQGLDVVGVDVSPAAVEHAAAAYVRPNLSFRVGDIAQPIFPAGSLDGILNSSVLHHVTSFNGYSTTPLTALLDNQTAALCDGGILVIRDFVIPTGPSEVMLELESADGAADGPVEALSSVALFERFLRTFRCHAYPAANIPFIPIELPGANRLSSTSRCFRTTLRVATEFVLRKDYRDSWEVELQEEYLYFSKTQFEHELQSRGLRVLLSKELYNPWILANRFEGKFLFHRLDGSPLPFPPTTYVIVAEKSHTGVALGERDSERRSAPGYLERRSFRAPGMHFDVIRRPLPVIDLLPWYSLHGDLFTLCRQGYPRPIVNSMNASPRLDGAYVSGYINEPIVAVVENELNVQQTVENVLAERAGVGRSAIREIRPGLSYFPSPGGTDERVCAFLVEIDPPAEGDLTPHHETGYASPAHIRAVEAEQYLRACQVGGMFDARLELNIYDLLIRSRRPLGPWIDVDVLSHVVDQPGLEIVSVSALLDRSNGIHFEETDRPAHFLDLWTGSFVEHGASGEILGERTFEYVTPRTHSTNTALALPFARTNGRIVIGLEARALPSIEINCGTSLIHTAPAWRLPRDIDSVERCRLFLKAKLREEFGVEAGELQALGGSYYPSIGIAPEQVTVFAAPVLAEALPKKVHWVALEELLAARQKFVDGHLLIAALRIAHACEVAPLSA